MLELTKDNFEQEVKNGEGYILVDFWSCLLYTSPSPRDD